MAQPYVVWLGQPSIPVNLEFAAKFELHGVPWTPDLKQGPCVILRRVGDQQQYSKDSWYRLHTSRKEGFQWSAADSAHEAGDFEFTLQIGDRMYPPPSSGCNRVSFTDASFVVGHQMGAPVMREGLVEDNQRLAALTNGPAPTAPPEPVTTPSAAAAVKSKGRMDAVVAVKAGGPLPLGALRYDDPPPPGLTCEAVFRAYHCAKGVSDDDSECLLAVIVGKLEDMVVQAVMECSRLSSDEAFAIVWYASDITMANPALDDRNAWKVANELLRMRSLPELDRLGLVPWLYWLLKGLTKLPPWAGKVYRGLSVPLLEISSSYSQTTVTWTAFTSTTTDRDGTMRKFGHSNTGGTFVQIEVTDARDISMFSPFAESERLLMPNSTFSVGHTLAYAQAVDFFELAGSNAEKVGLPQGTDMIILKQIDTPMLGKFLQPRTSS
eukprot:RCo030942